MAKKRAKKKPKPKVTPEVNEQVSKVAEPEVEREIGPNESCSGIFSLPIGISGAECLKRVESGLKKCYCADGGCKCRECQEGRKKMGCSLCVIAKVGGTCDVMPECKKCPKFSPCWT